MKKQKRFSAYLINAEYRRIDNIFITENYLDINTHLRSTKYNIGVYFPTDDLMYIEYVDNISFIKPFGFFYQNNFISGNGIVVGKTYDGQISDVKIKDLDLAMFIDFLPRRVEKVNGYGDNIYVLPYKADGSPDYGSLEDMVNLLLGNKKNDKDKK